MSRAFGEVFFLNFQVPESFLSWNFVENVANQSSFRSVDGMVALAFLKLFARN